mgnify:CR=1 FL=1
MSAKYGLDLYESFSCSVSNQADAFSEEGPTEGVSLFTYNYYGKKLMLGETGLFNAVNVKERRDKEKKHQVWTLDSASLLQEAGGTDSNFICAMSRDLNDPDALLKMKVGQKLTWVNGYKVFELKTSEGLDRFSDDRTTLTILDSAMLRPSFIVASIFLT